MRLTCPSCGAQYEVPPEAIPPAGREVQCSNCQHLWFERGSASPPPPQRLLDPEPWDSRPPPQDGDEEADDLADVATAPPPQAAPRPRMDPEVSRILREEAEREREARAAEAVRDGAAPTPRPTPPRKLHARGEGEGAPAEAPAAAPPPTPPTAARTVTRPARSVVREIDPDKISSSLQSQPQRAAQTAARTEPVPAPARRSGFGRGFFGALLLLAVLAAAYLLRPEITARVPAAAAVLDPFAGAVDAGRIWLNDAVGRLIGATPATE